jgi:CubicO group peptidase (beta-lactamase class C family)
LRPSEEPWPDIEIDHDGGRLGFDAWLTATTTDALIVLKDGRVVYEGYFDGMEPDDRHLIMSCSKSFTGVLCGSMVGDGLLSPDDLVTMHLPELAGTAWDGCTVQHLLDMRAGTRWDPEGDERLILEISDYVPRTSPDLPADTAAWIRTIDNQQPHGTDFHYTSLMTDVTAWVLERVAGEPFHELFARRIWSRIGAEADADLMTDASGFPLAEGGFCTTLRDFARFGQLCVDEGTVAGEAVVPASWFERLYVRDQDLIDAYANAAEYDPATPDACYHDYWWIHDAERRRYQGWGMSGQALLIDRPAGLVVAKFSTFPDVLDQERFALTSAGLTAITSALA